MAGLWSSGQTGHSNTTTINTQGYRFRRKRPVDWRETEFRLEWHCCRTVSRAVSDRGCVFVIVVRLLITQSHRQSERRLENMTECRVLSHQ